MSNTLTPVAEGSLFPLPALLHRFSVEEYHALADTGVLAPDARVELLDGLIVEMTPNVPPHAYVVEHVYDDVLRALAPLGWHARMQQPVTLASSEPQPDIAMVRWQRVDYLRKHPGPAAIGLIVEVADSTLAVDRAKAQLYAGAKVPQYWIINLGDRQVEAYSDPQVSTRNAAQYGLHQVVKAGGEIEFVLEGKTVGKIPVTSLLPPIS